MDNDSSTVKDNLMIIFVHHHHAVVIYTKYKFIEISSIA